MDEYFLAKKAVDILLENLNDNFVKCLINLSIQERYTSNIKLIIGIIDLIRGYLNMRRNDILSSCIKYTNKSYYIHLCDSLFRLLHNHLISNESIEMNENKYMFITDLINKYNNPIIPSVKSNNPTIIRKDNIRSRFNSIIGCNDDDEDDIAAPAAIAQNTKDAGTLFKEAYDLRKKHRVIHNNSNMKDIELQVFGINQNTEDLL